MKIATIKKVLSLGPNEFAQLGHAAKEDI